MPDKHRRNDYTTVELIENLREGLQIYPELLAQIFPDRVERFSDRDLARLWRGTNYQYIARVINKITNPNNKDYKPDFRFLDTEISLQLLEKKLCERLGVKVIGCLKIIQDYKNPSSGINTLRFIEMLENELGRVSGDVLVTNEELSLILAGDKDFIHRTLDTIKNPQSKRWYNPDYKFTLERLQYFRRTFQNILGFKAMKLLEHLDQYHLSNPDLQYWHEKDYSIRREYFFSEINLIIKAYWLGFLSADGSLDSRRPRISIELSIKDEGIINHLCDTIGLDKSRISHQQRFWKYQGKIVSGWKSSIKFSSKQIAEDLKNLDFLNLKSGKIGLPSIIKALIHKAKVESNSSAIPWYSTHSGRIAHTWLLGFYDGDGTYIGGKQGRIYSSNKKILIDVKYLFEIDNEVYLQTNLDKYLEEGKEIPKKSVYGLNLGPKVFQSMMDSYLFSLSRKRNSVYRNQGYIGNYI
ncbi:MAG: hypothetical protein ACFFDH_10320 [Promethearchaeota archaeon]